jgi:hypothetical protein
MKWDRNVHTNKAKDHTQESGHVREGINLLIDQLNPSFNMAR